MFKGDVLYNAYFQVHNLILCYYLNWFTCYGSHKKHQCSHTVQWNSTVAPPVWNVLAPVSLRTTLPDTQSHLIGQLTHAWPSTTNNNRAAVLNQFRHAKLSH